jgi:hypothetical protein
MTVLKWLGYAALGAVILTALLAILVAIRVIAILGGMVIAVGFIAIALKQYFAAAQKSNKPR